MLDQRAMNPNIASPSSAMRKDPLGVADPFRAGMVASMVWKAEDGWGRPVCSGNRAVPTGNLRSEFLSEVPMRNPRVFFCGLPDRYNRCRRRGIACLGEGFAAVERGEYDGGLPVSRPSVRGDFRFGVECRSWRVERWRIERCGAEWWGWG